MENPYQQPTADLNVADNLRYVGFWARFIASLVDTVILLLVICPILYLSYGKDYFQGTQGGAMFAGPVDILLNYIFPAIAVIVFWIYKSATPGKMVLKAKIIDAKSGGKPSAGQLIGRYLAYYVSMIPFGLGFLWVAWDQKKQGWHDKLASTLVIYENS